MELQDYCNSMQAELTAWKARIYDVARKFDKLSSGAKEKASSEVQDLHIMLEELGERITRLEKECPSEWSPIKTEIQDKFTHLRTKFESAWDTVSAAFHGG